MQTPSGPINQEPILGGTPIIGGTRILKGEDFKGEVKVYSAVYARASELPKDQILNPIQEGETVICMLVENSKSSVDNVDLLFIMNPTKVPIHATGFLKVVPDGYNESNRVHPSLLQGGEDSIQFGWQESISELKPGQWSAVFFRFNGVHKAQPAFVGNIAAGKLDSGNLFGPKVK